MGISHIFALLLPFPSWLLPPPPLRHGPKRRADLLIFSINAIIIGNYCECPCSAKRPNDLQFLSLPAYVCAPAEGKVLVLCRLLLLRRLSASLLRFIGLGRASVNVKNYTNYTGSSYKNLQSYFVCSSRIRGRILVEKILYSRPNFSPKWITFCDGKKTKTKCGDERSCMCLCMKCVCVWLLLIVGSLIWIFFQGRECRKAKLACCAHTR